MRIPVFKDAEPVSNGQRIIIGSERALCLTFFDDSAPLLRRRIGLGDLCSLCGGEEVVSQPIGKEVFDVPSRKYVLISSGNWYSTGIEVSIWWMRGDRRDGGGFRGGFYSGERN